MSRIIAIDPGAQRLGYAVMDCGDDELTLIDSGILGLEREFDGKKKEEFQMYKLRLIDYFAQKVPVLYRKHLPTRIVNETQPAVGGGSFIAATQSELAKAALTVFQTFAYASGLAVTQLGASTIKKALTDDGQATKARVRNAVISVFPHMSETLKKESTQKPPVWDRSDGIATGIAFFTTRKA